MFSRVKLKSVSKEIGSGITPLRSNPLFWDNGLIPWLKTEQLGENKIYETSEKITQYAIEKTSIKVFPVNTLSIAMYGEGRTRGNVSILKTAMTTNQACCNIVVDEKKANHEFIYYFLKTQYHQLRSLSSGVRKNLNSNDIKEFEIRLPKDIKTQQNIASVLSSLDSKIELNNRINAELEQMAKTIYDYWFVQFDFPMSAEYAASIGQPELEGKPYKSSGGKMVWNRELKREVPEGWEVGTFNSYCPSTGGFAFKSEWWTDKGVAVAKIKDIQEDYKLDTSDLARVDISDKSIDNKFKSKPGDILIAMTGATVGKYAIVPITDYPIYVNQRVGYFNLGADPCSKLPFLINSMNQSYFRNVIFTLANGAAQPNISNDQINNIPLLMPDRHLLEKFNDNQQAAYRKILINQKENQELTSLRDWLLPMLMNGQVRVGDVEEDLVGMAAEAVEEYKVRGK